MDLFIDEYHLEFSKDFKELYVKKGGRVVAGETRKVPNSSSMTYLYVEVIKKAGKFVYNFPSSPNMTRSKLPIYVDGQVFDTGGHATCQYSRGFQFTKHQATGVGIGDIRDCRDGSNQEKRTFYLKKNAIGFQSVRRASGYNNRVVDSLKIRVRMGGDYSKMKCWSACPDFTPF